MAPVTMATAKPAPMPGTCPMQFPCIVNPPIRRVLILSPSTQRDRTNGNFASPISASPCRKPPALSEASPATRPSARSSCFYTTVDGVVLHSRIFPSGIREVWAQPCSTKSLLAGRRRHCRSHLQRKGRHARLQLRCLRRADRLQRSGVGLTVTCRPVED
jgi:hypothetical protein